MSTFHQKSIQSLLCLLQGLSDCKTTIELRNEITVEGIIKDVDNRMNTLLKDATYTLLDGTSKFFDELFIPGVQIRYVHIPEDVNPMKVLQQKAHDEVTKDHKSVPFSKQTLSLKKMNRIEEEKKMVREFVLGKGRTNTKNNLTEELNK